MADEAEFKEEVRDSIKSNLTDATALEVARYVVSKLDREADNETLEYDFHIMVEQSEFTGMKVDAAYQEKNTWFKFDLDKNLTISNVKKAMFEDECNLTELEFIDDFMRKVCEIIEKDHAVLVETILKRVMFKNQPIDIKLERCTGLEIIDFSKIRPEENLALVVNKNVPQSVLNDGGGGGQVTAELFDIHFKTGEGFNEIIARKKREGDPNYQYVVDAETKKMLWEAQLDMFVNYFSPAKS